MDDKNLFDHIDDGMMEFFMNGDILDIDEYLGEMKVKEKDKKRQIQLAKKIRFKAQARLNQVKDEQLLEKAIKKIRSIVNESAEVSTSILQNMLLKAGVPVQFRNLKNLSEEDIKNVLTDINIVQLMEEIEKETNK